MYRAGDRQLRKPLNSGRESASEATRAPCGQGGERAEEARDGCPPRQSAPDRRGGEPGRRGVCGPGRVGRVQPRQIGGFVSPGPQPPAMSEASQVCSGYYSLNHSFVEPFQCPRRGRRGHPLSAAASPTSSTAAASRAATSPTSFTATCGASGGQGQGLAARAAGRLPCHAGREGGRPRPRDTLGFLGSLRGGGAPGAGEGPAGTGLWPSSG